MTTPFDAEHAQSRPQFDARPDVEGRSLGDLVGEVAEDLTRLFRQELELAKVEAKQEATKLGKGAGMLAGAGVAGHVVVLFLSVALMLLLGRVMDLDLAALIVAVLWAVVAGILASVGRQRLRSAQLTLDETKATLKEDVQWAKRLKD
jgi:Putative Actinobacterial Holin-X, holin superfamily III